MSAAILKKLAGSDAKSNTFLQPKQILKTLVSPGINRLHPNGGTNENTNSRIDQDTGDLFTDFRGLLILGRILGVLPCSGVFGRSYKGLQCNLISSAGLVSFFCISLLVLNAALIIWNAVGTQKRNILSIAKNIGGPFFGSWGLFIYVYFLYRRHQFIKIFKVWQISCQNLIYTRRDKHLRRTIIIVSVIMFASTVLENAVLHLEYFVYFDDINGHTRRWGKDTSNASIVKMYYMRSHNYWYNIIGYHPILVVMVFIVHKCILYGWNYTEILAALLCRALYFKFKALYQSAEKVLLKVTPPSAITEIAAFEEVSADSQAWTQLAEDHDSLCRVLDKINDFLSPLLFVSYTVNIYFFCIQLLMGLNPDDVQNSLVHSIYAPWSFIHIVLRVFILSFCAARVNEYAHKVRDVLRRCPPELYIGPVAKLEKLVNGGQKLGMSGLGCFVITKPFMLNLLNVVFTIEIVLLQGLSASTNTSTSACK